MMIALEGQRGGRRGQEGWPAPLHRLAGALIACREGSNKSSDFFAAYMHILIDSLSHCFSCLCFLFLKQVNQKMNEVYTCI